MLAQADDWQVVAGQQGLPNLPSTVSKLRHCIKLSTAQAVRIAEDSKGAKTICCKSCIPRWLRNGTMRKWKECLISTQLDFMPVSDGLMLTAAGSKTYIISDPRNCN